MTIKIAHLKIAHQRLNLLNFCELHSMAATCNLLQLPYSKSTSVPKVVDLYNADGVLSATHLGDLILSHNVVNPDNALDKSVDGGVKLWGGDDIVEETQPDSSM